MPPSLTITLHVGMLTRALQKNGPDETNPAASASSPCPKAQVLAHAERSHGLIFLACPNTTHTVCTEADSVQTSSAASLAKSSKYAMQVLP